MTEEFNLSDAIYDPDDGSGYAIGFENVKEFIKRLKEEIKEEYIGHDSYDECGSLLLFIDKLVGEKLI